MKYSVKAAAMATGVSPSRLRTWERRYGIPRPGRSDSGRRQYGEDDLNIIRRMAALVDAGMPASEAAQAVRTEAPVERAEVEEREHPLMLQLVDCCRSYDEGAMRRTVSQAVEEEGWEAALDEVILPALNRLGLEWQRDALVTANEHFASEVVRREIACASIPQAVGGFPRARVMLACAEDERHEIGLLALGLLLRQRGIGVYYIGADVPAVDLMDAVRRTGVDAVVLSATMRSSLASLEKTARMFVSGFRRLKLFVGGPAFDAGSSGSVPGIRLPRRVPDAAKMIAETLPGGGKEAA